MQQVKHIFKKEFKDYFVSPIAYIVISIFLIIAGIWFFLLQPFFATNQATLRPLFMFLPFIFSLIIPAITMRLFSEEINVGSYELLATLPVTKKDIVLGKFFASTIFIIVMLIPTIAYPIFIAVIGDLDIGPVVGGYLGAILLGAAYSSVGIFASALTRNQIIAFILGLLLCLIFTFIGFLSYVTPSLFLGFIDYLSASNHFQSISKGVVDSRDILYFLSVTFIALYCSTLAINEKQ